MMEKVLADQLPDRKFKNVSRKRSRAMSAVKGSGNKTTEMRLRFALVRNGISGWKMNNKSMKGKPDFFFPEKNISIFVDGCFWHGCPDCGHIPKTNTKYWDLKIRRNIERDSETTLFLQEQGVTVLRFWEHQLKDTLVDVINSIKAHIE